MFVFIVIFSYFRIPIAYQHRVLFFGILGAILLRGIFIAAGVALINAFEWMIYVFGAFLVYTAVRMARGGETMHPENSRVLSWITRRFPTTGRFDGQKLFTSENGRRVATPLFIALIFIDVIDLMFAVDSIPAIFAVTRDPFVVLSSNVFAVLGLRALYFLLAGAVDRFHLLKYGLAVILAFVGLKMLAEAIHFQVPIVVSLGFIVAVLGVTVALSLVVPGAATSGGDSVAARRGDPDGRARR
jgi:tellurite resistance protein TerC